MSHRKNPLHTLVSPPPPRVSLSSSLLVASPLPAHTVPPALHGPGFLFAFDQPLRLLRHGTLARIQAAPWSPGTLPLSRSRQSRWHPPRLGIAAGDSRAALSPPLLGATHEGMHVQP